MKQQKGFTLIELLVVIAIIGLLSTLAVVSLNNARQKSRDAKRLSDIKQVQTALELYYNDNNGYPTALGSQIGSATSTIYMATVPTAPTPADGTCSGAQNTYTYTSGGTSTYSIAFCLGGATGGLGAGVRTASQSGIQ